MRMWIADLNNVVYSVVISLSYIDTNGLEDHAIPPGPSLDGICAGDHLRVPWAAKWTGLCRTTTTIVLPTYSTSCGEKQCQSHL